MAVTVADFALYLGGVDSTADPDGLARFLTAAREVVTGYAPDAPETVADLAVLRLASHSYHNRAGSIGGEAGRLPPDPFVASGARHLLARWRAPSSSTTTGGE